MPPSLCPRPFLSFATTSRHEDEEDEINVPMALRDVMDSSACYLFYAAIRNPKITELPRVFSASVVALSVQQLDSLEVPSR